MKIFFMSTILCVTLLSATIPFHHLHFTSYFPSTYCNMELAR